MKHDISAALLAHLVARHHSAGHDVFSLIREFGISPSVMDQIKDGTGNGITKNKAGRVAKAFGMSVTVLEKLNMNFRNGTYIMPPLLAGKKSVRQVTHVSHGSAQLVEHNLAENTVTLILNRKERKLTTDEAVLLDSRAFDQMVLDAERSARISEAQKKASLVAAKRESEEIEEFARKFAKPLKKAPVAGTKQSPSASHSKVAAKSATLRQPEQKSVSESVSAPVAAPKAPAEGKVPAQKNKGAAERPKAPAKPDLSPETSSVKVNDGTGRSKATEASSVSGEAEQKSVTEVVPDPVVAPEAPTEGKMPAGGNKAPVEPPKASGEPKPSPQTSSVKMNDGTGLSKAVDPVKRSLASFFKGISCWGSDIQEGTFVISDQDGLVVDNRWLPDQLFEERCLPALFVRFLLEYKKVSRQNFANTFNVSVDNYWRMTSPWRHVAFRHYNGCVKLAGSEEELQEIYDQWRELIDTKTWERTAPKMRCKALSERLPGSPEKRKDNRMKNSDTAPTPMPAKAEATADTVEVTCAETACDVRKQTLLNSLIQGCHNPALSEEEAAELLSEIFDHEVICASNITEKKESLRMLLSAVSA